MMRKATIQWMSLLTDGGVLSFLAVNKGPAWVAKLSHGQLKGKKLPREIPYKNAIIYGKYYG